MPALPGPGLRVQPSQDTSQSQASLGFQLKKGLPSPGTAAFRGMHRSPNYGRELFFRQVVGAGSFIEYIYHYIKYNALYSMVYGTSKVKILVYLACQSFQLEGPSI